MKTERKPGKYDNYLAIRIIEAIGKSDLLEKDKKIAAIKDIARMYEDETYVGMDDIMIMFILEFYKDSIAKHHPWVRSELGVTFWSKMDRIIGTV